MQTRFNNDPARQLKRLQQTTDVGRYILNVPGCGDDMPYMADPFVRLQGWGANMRTDAVDIEFALRSGGHLDMQVGRGNPRDCRQKPIVLPSRAYTYSTSSALTTDQSRATDPAWMLRESPLSAPIAVYAPKPTEMPFAYIESRDVEMPCKLRPLRPQM
jgi:hypothetical protein